MFKKVQKEYNQHVFMSTSLVQINRSVHLGQGPAFRERLYSFIMYNLGCTSSIFSYNFLVYQSSEQEILKLHNYFVN